MYKTNPILVERCRALRTKGFTLGQIVEFVQLPKTTVYDKIKNIPLSQKVKDKIKAESTKRINDYIRRERKGKCLPGRTFTKPQKWSLGLIFLVSHFIFDGRVAPSGCEYYNRNDSLIVAVNETMEKVFGVTSKIYPRDFGVKQLRYYYVELRDFVRNKILELPNYIRTALIAEKKVFLQSFFDDEGSVHFEKRLVRGY